MMVVKRYAGARLYQPAAGRYVTVDELRRWRAAGTPVAVIDAATGVDVTIALLG